MRVAVYTSIISGFDCLYNPDVTQSIDCDYYCFADYAHISHLSTAWHTIPLPIMMSCPRMTAKYYKVMSHEVFPDGRLAQKYHQLLTYPIPEYQYDYTIWIDGGLVIKNPGFVQHAISSIGDTGWAMFTHPTRDCLYKELDISTDKKYQGLPLKEQVEHYKEYGIPPCSGLMACTVIARKVPEPIQVRLANTLWMAENYRWTYQDQLSLPWVLHSLGFSVDSIPGNLWAWEWFYWLSRPKTHEG